MLFRCMKWNPISAKITCPQVVQKGECTPKLGWVVRVCELPLNIIEKGDHHYAHETR
jgi:hypothetical protein